MDHLALAVSDQARSIRFYADYFGFVPEPEPREDGVHILHEQLRKPFGRGSVEHRYTALALIDEALDFGPKRRVASAHLQQHRRALPRLRIEHRVDERRELLPSVGQQRSEVATWLPQLTVAHADIARRNSIRAFAQSR